MIRNNSYNVIKLYWFEQDTIEVEQRVSLNDKSNFSCNMFTSESLNIERRYSCRAMLNFEPVAPPATGGIS